MCTWVYLRVLNVHLGIPQGVVGVPGTVGREVYQVRWVGRCTRDGGRGIPGLVKKREDYAQMGVTIGITGRLPDVYPIVVVSHPERRSNNARKLLRRETLLA